MLKRIVVLAMVIMLLLICIPKTKAYDKNDNIKITLNSEDYVIEKDNKIAVTMNLELSGESIDSLGATINYDPSILSFDTESEIETFEETNWETPEYNNNNGMLMIDTFRESEDTAKSGKMFTLYFNVLKTVEKTTISIEDPINCAYLGNDIWCTGSTLELSKKEEAIYSIEYNANTTDSVNNMPQSGSKKQGEPYTVEGTPTREGYTFAGWSTNKEGTGTLYKAGDTYTIDANTIFYAQWKEKEIQTDELYLMSDIYKIGDENISEYQPGDVYISRIAPETTLEIFKTKCSTNGEITIYKENGEELGENEYIGTNMKLQITKNDEKIELTIAVKGDIDGNGEIDITDLVNVRKHIQEVKNVEGIYFIAGDINEDNSLDITDLVKIRKHIQEVEYIK